jgi:hypothetical protein
VAGKSRLSVDDHLKSVPAAVRPILVAARKTIRAAAPAADEIPYQSRPPKSASAMWKVARYAVGGEEVAGLGTFARHSTIYFYRGRELEDPGGLLQGSGKDTRFVTLRTPADAEGSAVRKLLRDAFRLRDGGASL